MKLNRLPQTINIFTRTTKGKRREGNDIRDRNRNLLVTPLEEKAITALSSASIPWDHGAAMKCLIDLAGWKQLHQPFQARAQKRFRQVRAAITSMVNGSKKTTGTDILNYSPRYRSTITGRISEKGGNIQATWAGFRRAVLSGFMVENGGDLYNYDIVKSQCTNISVSTGFKPLQAFLKIKNSTHAQRLRTDEGTFKRLLYGTIFNGGKVQTAPAQDQFKVEQARDHGIYTIRVRKANPTGRSRKRTIHIRLHRPCSVLGSGSLTLTGTKNLAEDNADGPRRVRPLRGALPLGIHTCTGTKRLFCIKTSVDGKNVLRNLGMMPVPTPSSYADPDKQRKLNDLRVQISRKMRKADWHLFCHGLGMYFLPVTGALDILYEKIMAGAEIQKSGRNSGRSFIKNLLGRTLYLDIHPRTGKPFTPHTRKKTALAFDVQGKEAAIIHSITVRGKKYRFEPLLNLHDGLITRGPIPQACIDEVIEDLGIPFELIPKPL
ncbi:MAG: hypothetical protein GX442_10190 [Candidatus Riflebacteria bacterium]|nr:hypothetical protein [Candidatus Riflebacteria bacterium]